MATPKIYLGTTVVSGGGGGGTPDVVVTSSAGSIDEGSSVTFTLTTDPATAGASILWALSGVSAADVVGGVMTGTATANGAGVATVVVSLSADSATEGSETMTMNAGVVSGSASVTVNDTSVLITARYWRMMNIQALDPAGSYFEICEIYLCDGSEARLSTPTPTCSPVQYSGALSSLNDQVLNASDRPYWLLPGNVQLTGFWIKWDFGAANDQGVKYIRYANAQIPSQRGLKGFLMQWSNDDSNWNNLLTVSGLSNPGEASLSGLIPVQ